MPPWRRANSRGIEAEHRQRHQDGGDRDEEHSRDARRHVSGGAFYSLRVRATRRLSRVDGSTEFASVAVAAVSRRRSPLCASGSHSSPRYRGSAPRISFHNSRGSMRRCRDRSTHATGTGPECLSSDSPRPVLNGPRSRRTPRIGDQSSVSRRTGHPAVGEPVEAPEVTREAGVRAHGGRQVREAEHRHGRARFPSGGTGPRHSDAIHV